jgi:hypothetical protein
MFPQIGETVDGQQTLREDGFFYDVVFEDPGIAMGNEDRVQTRGQRGIDV